MTIDEAIADNLQIAEGQDKCAEISVSEHAKERMKVCAANHRQLAAWLRELKELRLTVGMIKVEDLKSALTLLREYKADNNELREQIEEYKRLLKAAVEDMRWVNENTQDAEGTCIMRNCEGCGDCPLDIKGDLWCKWKHEAEALKLIGGEENDS